MKLFPFLDATASQGVTHDCLYKRLLSNVRCLINSKYLTISNRSIRYLLEQQDPKDHQDPKDQQDPKDHQDPKDQQDPKINKI